MSDENLRKAPNSGVLDGVPESLRSFALRRARVIRLPKGRTLLEKDSRSTDVFILREGSARVVLYSPGGREVWVNTAGAGDIIGEIAALDSQPRSTSVVALSDLVVAVITAAEFLGCLEASPEAAVWLARRFAAGMRKLTEQVYELSVLNVQTRIQRELLRLARSGQLRNGFIEINPAPSHAELASRIGTHREAVTREMRALSKENIIRSGRRSLTIMDPERLKRATRQS
jgi:CRP/FNR family transcriptional regulator, cyclic AMP receptor protein